MWLFDALSIHISPTLRRVSVFLEVVIKGFEEVLLWPPEGIILILVGICLVVGWYQIGGFFSPGLWLLWAWEYGRRLWQPLLWPFPNRDFHSFWYTLGSSQRKAAQPGSDYSSDTWFHANSAQFCLLDTCRYVFWDGQSSSLAATMIFAMPPAVRLTNLGIREVSKEMGSSAFIWLQQMANSGWCSVPAGYAHYNGWRTSV